jgi:hypothetical protein
MASGGDEPKKLIGRAMGKPVEGCGLIGEGFVSGGRGIDEAVESDAEVAVLPN